MDISNQWRGSNPTTYDAGEMAGQTQNSVFNNGAMSPEVLAALQQLGWTGGNPLTEYSYSDNGVGGGAANNGNQFTPAFQQWADSIGLTSQTVQAGNNQLSQQFVLNGQPVTPPNISSAAGEGNGIVTAMALGLGGVLGPALAGASGAADGAALAGPEATQTGYAGFTGAQAAGAGAGAGATYDVGYQPYTGPGSEGFQVAGDNAVAPEGWGSTVSPDLTMQGAANSGFDAAGGYGAAGDANWLDSSIGWLKANPGLANLGGSLINSIIGATAAKGAANTQAGAANAALAATVAQNAQIRADNAPWRAAGATALGQIGDLMGTSGRTGAANYGSLMHQFNADDLKTNLAPNYQFMLDQGLGAATNAGNAAGFSGNTIKGINDYAQGYAANGYQQAFNNYNANQTNIYNRLSNLAGLGQTANQTTAQSGVNLTNLGQNFATSGAAASAGGTIGAANAIQNGISNAGGWNYLNNQPVYSDARLKTDIKRVGETDGGLGVYLYRYKTGGPVHMGVMAQEVEQVAPGAVTRDAAGFRKVNYTMLRDF